MMKLVWSPETASKVYIDTVKSLRLILQGEEFKESAEFVPTMAGGWNTKFIVEAPSRGAHADSVATSVGLAVAARHTGGRHVCVVPDEKSRAEYMKARHEAHAWSAPPEMAVGDAEEVMAGLEGVDFLVVDGRRMDCSRVVRSARLSHSGAVLVRKNNSDYRRARCGFGGAVDRSRRVVRSVTLPIGRGLDVAYVGGSGGGASPPHRPNRWVRRVDQKTGEEHLIRG